MIGHVMYDKLVCAGDEVRMVRVLNSRLGEYHISSWLDSDHPDYESILEKVRAHHEAELRRATSA